MGQAAQSFAIQAVRNSKVINHLTARRRACPLSNPDSEGNDAVEQDDPRRDLDQFTAALVEKLRDEIEIVAKELVSAQAEVALAQVDVLRKRALHRLKTIDFEHSIALSEHIPGQLSQDDVLKIFRITISALEQTFDFVREHIVACEEAIYPNRDEDNLPE